ncbi:MAG: hypothetical protein LBN93_00910 [Candidatus Symbiothrix sp.]|jgi:hypothetical protein|nr:hypothetical protein [Candidatus Symbiothrix sp.]
MKKTQTSHERIDNDLKEDALNQSIIDALHRRAEEPAWELFDQVSGADELREIMRHAEETGVPEKPKATKLPILIYASIAAVLLLLLVWGVQPRFSTQELYQHYSKITYVQSEATRGEQGSENNPERSSRWHQALDYLKIGKRAETKTLLLEMESQGQSFDASTELLEKLGEKNITWAFPSF